MKIIRPFKFLSEPVNIIKGDPLFVYECVGKAHGSG